MDEPKPDWQLNTDHAIKNRFKKLNADHPKEYASLFSNLKKIKDLLDQGSKVGGFNVGFFRSEGGGVYRIGQTGVRDAKESRLYVYPDQERQIMYVLTAGTKDEQSDDVKSAKHTVTDIRKTLQGQ